MDPVTLGLCTQIALDMEVQKADKNRPVEASEGESGSGEQLISAAETQSLDEQAQDDMSESDEVNADNVFSKFSNLKSNDANASEEDDS